MTSEMKTQKTKKSPKAFLKMVVDAQKRKDSEELLKIFETITGEKSVMWGPSIIGYGEYTYKRRDGSTHTFLMTGFSPRAQNITLYLMPGFKKYPELLKKLGPHKTSAGCLYIKRISDVHMPSLKKLIERAYKDMKKQYKGV